MKVFAGECAFDVLDVVFGEANGTGCFFCAVDKLVLSAQFSNLSIVFVLESFFNYYEFFVTRTDHRLVGPLRPGLT